MRGLEYALASVRLLFGTSLLAAPSVGARMWVGDQRGTRVARAMSRWLGVRDIALGWTLARATRLGTPARRQVFLEAALVDVADAAIAYRFRGRLPGAWWPLVAVGAGVMGIADFALAMGASRRRR